MSDGVVRSEIADMHGHGALPRSNGELVFAAPWEGRALAMAIGVVKALGLAWDEFRLRLIAEISAQPESSYYEKLAHGAGTPGSRHRRGFGGQAGRIHGVAQ